MEDQLRHYGSNAANKKSNTTDKSIDRTYQGLFWPPLKTCKASTLICPSTRVKSEAVDPGAPGRHDECLAAPGLVDQALIRYLSNECVFYTSRLLRMRGEKEMLVYNLGHPHPTALAQWLEASDGTTGLSSDPEPRALSRRELEEAGDSRRPAGMTRWLRRLLAIFTLIISGSDQSPGSFESG